MGRLIERPLSTLFQGVSRQPDTVRLAGQVEEADNTLLSVVSGGFEKRPGSVHVAALASDLPEDLFTHSYTRDASEGYIVAISNGSLRVFDIFTGQERTVATPNGVGYLTVTGEAAQSFRAQTIADATFILNREVTTALAAAGTGTVAGTVQDFDSLPASPTQDDIYEITGNDADNFTGYYVQWDGAVWKETVKPDEQNAIDPATMPMQLLRESDGTFTLSEIAWEPRKVGDPILVPDPDFIGKTLQDITFFRDRLTLIAGEHATPSQAGDYFNFWPDKAIDVLDSDPITRTASSDKVNLLRHAVPFRRTLFLTSELQQFELTSNGTFTPRTADMEPVTAYAASPLVRPVALGNVLYFAAETGGASVMWEYIVNEDSLSNTATDVTKHALGYIPSSLVQMAGDTTTGTLFCLSNGDRDAIYVYNFFWQNEEKIQSSWNRWIFDGANIRGIHFERDKLHLVVRRGVTTYLETVRATNEMDASDAFRVSFDVTTTSGKVFMLKVPLRLDRRLEVTGVYDSGTGTTAWTLPYDHGSNLVGVLGNAWAEPGTLLNLSFPTTNMVTAPGDWSANPVIFGQRYDLFVELSKIYYREQDGRAVTSGRLTLKRMQLDYQNTGPFVVVVTPKGRGSKTKAFTGRILGDEANQVGAAPVTPRGTFKFRVGSRAEEVTIEITSDSHLPVAITSAAWTGFFNEISRAG